MPARWRAVRAGFLPSVVTHLRGCRNVAWSAIAGGGPGGVDEGQATVGCGADCPGTIGPAERALRLALCVRRRRAGSRPDRGWTPEDAAGYEPLIGTGPLAEQSIACWRGGRTAGGRPPAAVAGAGEFGLWAAGCRTSCVGGRVRVTVTGRPGRAYQHQLVQSGSTDGNR